MDDSISQLYAGILAARDSDPAVSKTARLFQDGLAKIAKKLAEEAVEVSLSAVQVQREAVILESADLLYNLCVLWAACDIAPADVAAEISRRQRVYGIAEKLPKKAMADRQERRMETTGPLTGPAQRI